MKRVIVLLLCILVSHDVVSAIEFSGRSYVVYDASSNQVLEQKDMNHVQSVASISKIMTAIIVIENASLESEVIVDEIINEAWGSAIYIHIGDVITIQDLLYGLMLRSGNDAALMLAKSVGEDVETFVELMNQKAIEIGMNNTKFNNPSGLDEEDDGNLSSAYDMAILMDYCMDNPIFRKIVGTSSYKRLDGNGTWTNKNRLLEEYEYCIGGKTGYTTKAKRTLVTLAMQENTELIVVTINCGNDFEFHKDRFIHYFENYQRIKLHAKGILQEEDERYILPNDVFIDVLPNDTIKTSVIDGKLIISRNDQIIESYQLEDANLMNSIITLLQGLLYG